MKIDIAQAVRSEYESFEQSYDGPLEAIDFMGARFEFENAHIDVVYRFDGERITVEGQLKTQTKVVCSRCLNEFSHPVEFSFFEYYMEQPGEDESVYQYSNDTADLTKMLQDNIVLNLPMRFLCSEDCKGLCTECGANLNEVDCGCGKGANGSPFAVLNEIDHHKEE